MVTQPQTIDFELRMRFMHIERSANKPEEICIKGMTFDEILERVSVEKRRRKRGDRLTSAEYRQHLTQHGRDMIASDDDHYTEERYKDAIEGTWFTWC